MRIHRRTGWPHWRSAANARIVTAAAAMAEGTRCAKPVGKRSRALARRPATAKATTGDRDCCRYKQPTSPTLAAASDTASSEDGRTTMGTNAITAPTVSTWRDTTRAAQTHTAATVIRHSTSATGEPEGAPAANAAPTTAAPMSTAKAEFGNFSGLPRNHRVAMEPSKNVAAAINPQ